MAAAVATALARRGDRRRAPRWPSAEQHGIGCARARPGREVRVIDVSAGGALIETAHRLLPGSAIELLLATSHRQTSIRGRVLRCRVARLDASTVWYRGAIGFDGPLLWYDEPGDLDAAG
jgi:hypothetical protein